MPVDAEVKEVIPPASAAPGESAATERSVLKRKRADAGRSEASKLKEKKRQAPSERRDSDDITVLKAKLADSSARAPVQRDAPVAARTQPRPVRADRCRIGWWRGYLKSEFYAHGPSLRGRDAVVATSPSFRWSKREPPPPDLGEAVQAHAVLREELEAAGWVAVRHGADWYAVEFERRPVGRGRGRAEHEH